MFEITGTDIINFAKEFGPWTLIVLIVVVSSIITGYKREVSRQKDQRALRSQNSRLRKAESEERKKTMELLLSHIQVSSEKMADLTIEVSKGVGLLKENIQFLEKDIEKQTELSHEADKEYIARFTSLQVVIDSWNEKLSEINRNIIDVAKGGKK